MTESVAVRLNDAGKRFGEEWVVRHLDFAVPQGTILGLIGPSGSGKTTCVRMANGVYSPDEGDVNVLGKAPSDFSSSDRASIGYLPQTPVLFENLSLWENLNFHASLNGVRFKRKARLHELLELVDLDGEQKKLVRESSGGMKRRIALAATLVHDPALLMLDEPTAGIDPILRRRFWEHFRELRDRGHTLVVTTQYVGEATDCDVVGLLADGKLAALGSPDDLRRQAFGGEVLVVKLEQPLDDNIVAAMDSIEGVTSAQATDRHRMRLVVDDGGAALPLVLDRVQRAGFSVEDSEEVVAPFDDVFIELVGRSGADTSPSLKGTA